MLEAPSAGTHAITIRVDGDTVVRARDPLGFFEKRYAEHGPVSRMGAMGKRWVCLLGPDAAEAVFRNAKTLEDRDASRAADGSWQRHYGSVSARPYFSMRE